MNDQELIEFIENAAGSFEQWVSLMKFGENQLRERRLVCLRLVVREAEGRIFSDEPELPLDERVIRIVERLQFSWLTPPPNPSPRSG